MSKLVGIIDFGAGNIFSVDNALKSLTRNRFISSDPQKLEKADAIIFPGVGTFKDGMKNIKERKLDVFIKNFIAEGKPLLGICVGMQLLLSKGYEQGETDGLDLIKGKVCKLEHTGESRIPHIGWNEIYGKDMGNIPIFEGIKSHSCYYFVHSYHATITEKVRIIKTDFYGTDIIAGFQKDNLFATQFHPEKSQKLGIQILYNFLQVGPIKC